MQAPRMGQTSSVNSFSVMDCISRKYRVYTVRVGVWEKFVNPRDVSNAILDGTGRSKLMAELLNGLEDFVVPYLDDIAIFSDTWESHLKHVETVLQRIKKAKLTINLQSVNFSQRKSSIREGESCNVVTLNGDRRLWWTRHSHVHLAAADKRLRCGRPRNPFLTPEELHPADRKMDERCFELKLER
ncbi:hypothetical protein TNCV_3914161 [Trichonephila clavipes]|nr:hypothetical protein TNCV_3914161 [Trichonephila clavipes]